jgi:hypothetical protein
VNTDVEIILSESEFMGLFVSDFIGVRTVEILLFSRRLHEGFYRRRCAMGSEDAMYRLFVKNECEIIFNL